MSASDLSPASIGDNLGTGFIGRKIIYYPRLGSTMDAARQQARQGIAEGAVIIAGEQTGGRGRIKRRWLSPGGNIALSVVIYPRVSSLPYLIMIASLAVAHSIEAVTGLKTQIKWPNDVLIKGKKVCGILVENEVKGNSIYAVIGIGINVSLRTADFPEITDIAASLNEESGKEISRVDIIRHILVEMERLYLTLPGGESIYQEWRGRLVTIGKRVRVESGGNIIEGIAEDVDSSGALRLRHADGSATMIVAGDVTLRNK